jgi:hypothetical protein
MPGRTDSTGTAAGGNSRSLFSPACVSNGPMRAGSGGAAAPPP